MASNFNLAWPFSVKANRYSHRVAVCADGREHMYAETLAMVRRMAQWLTQGCRKPRYVGILASRSWEACVGILAALWAGAAYVPLNLSLPTNCLLEPFRTTELDALISQPDAKNELRQRMPPHMVPTAVHMLETLPVNTNGKIDRKVLVHKLEEGEF